MLATALVTVTLFIPGGAPAQVDVVRNPANPAHSIGAPAHWTVSPNLGRQENCRAVIDARRLLNNMRPTKWMPHRCLSKLDRSRTPDPA